MRERSYENHGEPDRFCGNVAACGRGHVAGNPSGRAEMLGSANMIPPDNSIVRELDDAQRSTLSAIHNIDQYLRWAPNGDGPLLVQIKLACFLALDALGKAAELAENGR